MRIGKNVVVKELKSGDKIFEIHNGKYYPLKVLNDASILNDGADPLWGCEATDGKKIINLSSREGMEHYGPRLVKNAD